MKVQGLRFQVLTSNLHRKRYRKDMDQRRSRRRQLTGKQLLQPSPLCPVMLLLPSHRQQQFMLLRRPMNRLSNTRLAAAATELEAGLMA